MNWILLLTLISLRSFAACLQDSSVILTDENFSSRNIEKAADFFQNQVGHLVPQNMNVIVKLDFLNSRVNAEVLKRENEVTIEVWGGMLKHPLMTENSLKLLLCHEMGHVLGGAPLKSRNGWSSTEGQSDYYSSLECAHHLGISEFEFFEAALNLTKIYAEVSREPVPNLESCDESIVSRTNFGYPKAQCRLDTLLAGWRRQDRPRCWFIE
jgi:hypothetical protein